MASKRSYGEMCPAAHALDLVGDRWALLVVRDLRLGPKRFSDLQAGLPGAGPNMLAQRLRDLEDIGVVARRTLAPPAASKVYELTEWGAQLGPIISALARWGAQSPALPTEGHLSADSVMLGLRTFFEAPEAADWNTTYEVGLERDRFTIRVQGGQIAEMRRGQPHVRPDAMIETDPATMRALLAREQSVATALGDGRLTLTGDTAAAQRLLEARASAR